MGNEQSEIGSVGRLVSLPKRPALKIQRPQEEQPTMISSNRTSMHASVLRVAGLALIASAMAPSFLNTETTAQNRRPIKHLSICGNQTAPCKTIATFQPYNLPFRLPENAVIYDTELFYAIILKSVNAKEDDCDVFVSEKERLATQALFPANKVFSSRCFEPGDLSYTNTNPNQRFMAVYAGMTRAEANRMLGAVRATGKFPGANIRRMRAEMNGT